MWLKFFSVQMEYFALQVSSFTVQVDVFTMQFEAPSLTVEVRPVQADSVTVLSGLCRVSVGLRTMRGDAFVAQIEQVFRNLAR
jgi:hypothetical protein